MATKQDTNLMIAQAIGEISQAQKQTAQTLEHLKDNLKTLNDHNILHAERDQTNHHTVMAKLQVLTDKYWWLILILIGALMVALGAPKIASFFIPG